MIEEMGTVVAVEGDFAWIETQVKTTCGSCKASDGCPTSVVAKAFTPKEDHIKLSVPCKLVVGQQVKIGIAEQALLRASTMMYIVPIILMIAAATMVQFIFPSIHELLLLLVATLAAFAGFWWASVYAKKTANQHKFQPVFLGATQGHVMTQKHEIPTHKLD